MSIPGRITVGLLATEAILFCLALFSGGSYFLWSIGGAASCILTMIGAVLGPVAFLVGMFGKKPSVRRCGYALLVLNTIPLAIVIIVGQCLFSDHYKFRKADGTLRTKSVETQGRGYSPPATRSTQSTP